MTTHEAINLIITSSLLKTISGLELSILLHYVARADKDGVAWPSSETIASSLGHKNGNHVRTARARLIANGLLIRMPQDGHRAPYRLNFASLVGESQSGTSPENGLGQKRDGGESQIGTGGSPEMGRGVVPNRDIEPVHEPVQEPDQRTNTGGVGSTASKLKTRTGTTATAVATPPTPGFDRFWIAWPQHFRKQDRAKCLTRWQGEGLESRTDAILANVAASARSEQWTKDRGQFMPAPLVYLTRRSYDAPPPPVTSKAACVAPNTLTKDQTDSNRRDALAQANAIALKKLDRDACLDALSDAELAQLVVDVCRPLAPEFAALIRDKDPRRNEPLRWQLYDLIERKRTKEGTAA